MERRDSGYGADMDLPEDARQGQGQKGVLRTLPEDDQEPEQITASPDEVSNISTCPPASPQVRLHLRDIQRDSLLSSYESFESNITDDSDLRPPVLTVSHDDDDDESDSPDDKIVTSPNEFVFWEEPHNSPVPRKALLRATLSLPVSPVHSLSDSCKESIFQFTDGDVKAITKQTVDRCTSPLLLPREHIADKPRPRSSHANLMPPSNTLGGIYSVCFQGYLWHINLMEGTKTTCWFVLSKERLLMFDGDMPEAEISESWDLAECKIASVPQKVEFALVTRFAVQHSFQIKRNETKSITILSAETETVCKEWIQELTSASNQAWKEKGNNRLFQTLSLKSHFRKSPNSWRQKKSLLPKKPKISAAHFTDTYGWSEQQSHERVHRTTPIKTKVDKYMTERESTDLNRLVRASSDSQLASHTGNGVVLDRSHSTEPKVVKHESRSKFGSLRKTLAGLPQLGGKTPPLKQESQRPVLAISHSTPLEPSAKAGILLVKRHTSWNRCWVKLHGSNLHFYKDASEPLPFEVISLLGYCVHHTAGTNSPVGQVRFKFILQSEEKGSIQFLADTELDGKHWVKRFQEACSSGNMSAVLTSPPLEDVDGYDHNINETIQSDASDSPSESPLLQQRRSMIHKKYQQANETEEMNSLKRSLILNQRRMSAQTKLNALDKQRLEQKKLRAKNKKGRSKCEPALTDEFDVTTKELINDLKQKVANIDRELNNNILKMDQRRQALLRKQEMELEILHQERELMKYRSRAHAALKTMMLKSVIPSPLSEEKEFELDQLEAVSNLPVASSSDSYGDHLHGKTNSISSSMSSLSSNSTNESYGSSYSNSKNSPRLEQLSSRSTDSVFSNQVSTPDSGIHQPISKKYSPISSPDIRAAYGRIPEQDSLNTSDSDSVDGVVTLSTNIKPKLRTEVPPEVLRDINQFEEMAKLALRKAGWLPADIF